MSQKCKGVLEFFFEIFLHLLYYKNIRPVSEDIYIFVLKAQWHKMVLRDTEDVKRSVFNVQDFTNIISRLIVFTVRYFTVRLNLQY